MKIVLLRLASLEAKVSVSPGKRKAPTTQITKLDSRTYCFEDHLSSTSVVALSETANSGLLKYLDHEVFNDS